MTSLATTPRSRRRSGFTLVELMVVILIIAFLSGITLTAIGGGNDSRQTDAGISQLRSLFSLAHSAAISRNQTTRVLIAFDPDRDEEFLRYALIVYLDDEDLSGGSDGTWKVYSDGQYLPDGVYFTPGFSTGGDSPDLQLWGVDLDRSDFTVSIGASDQISVSPYSPSATEDPLSDGPGTNRWYSYEFQPNGTFENPGARVVLIQAIRVDNKLIFPQADEDTEPVEGARGFVIFRSGKPMFFQDPEQIKEGN